MNWSSVEIEKAWPKTTARSLHNSERPFCIVKLRKVFVICKPYFMPVRTSAFWTFFQLLNVFPTETFWINRRTEQQGLGFFFVAVVALQIVRERKTERMWFSFSFWFSGRLHTPREQIGASNIRRVHEALQGKGWKSHMYFLREWSYWHLKIKNPGRLLKPKFFRDFFFWKTHDLVRCTFIFFFNI